MIDITNKEAVERLTNALEHCAKGLSCYLCPRWACAVSSGTCVDDAMREAASALRQFMERGYTVPESDKEE